MFYYDISNVVNGPFHSSLEAANIFSTILLHNLILQGFIIITVQSFSFSDNQLKRKNCDHNAQYICLSQICWYNPHTLAILSYFVTPYSLNFNLFKESKVYQNTYSRTGCYHKDPSLFYILCHQPHC